MIFSVISGINSFYIGTAWLRAFSRGGCGRSGASTYHAGLAGLRLFEVALSGRRCGLTAAHSGLTTLSCYASCLLLGRRHFGSLTLTNQLSH